MAYTQYWRVKDDVLWGLEKDFNKLPTSEKEEALLKESGVFAIALDTGAYRIWNSIDKKWY